MVRKNATSGVGYPLHVRKDLSNGGIQGDDTIACEDDKCASTRRIAWRSGLKTAERKHLKNASEDPKFPEMTVLDVQYLANTWRPIKPREI